MGVTPEEGAAESAAALDEVAESLVTLWSLAHNASDVPVPATQLRVLFILEHGPVNVSNLAAEMDALVSSASRLCDRLEAAGLLLRDPGRDRREVTVRLSADGQALLDRLKVRRQDDLARVLATMSSPARAALIWGLTQFREAATVESGPDSADKSFSLPA
ncbi:MarR family transcriptional regulator [Spirillospora sp. NPDC048911]|uniref:MarR family transcriptional regulator n=1 Tax=Spirillospora sp. NPDC048911 TaxID=3364527 RepID=UPI003717DA49